MDEIIEGAEVNVVESMVNRSVVNEAVVDEIVVYSYVIVEVMNDWAVDDVTMVEWVVSDEVVVLTTPLYISQFVPLYNEIHPQKYPLVPNRLHTPLFWQGFGKQGSSLKMIYLFYSNTNK